MISKNLFIALAVFLACSFIFVNAANAAIFPSRDLIAPDSPFYFLQTWKESIQTFFTFNAENKAKQYFHIAEVSFDEYQKMMNKGKTEIADKILQKYEKQLNQAIDKADELKQKGSDITDLSQKIGETVAKHLEVLQNNLEKVPESVKAGLQKAIEASDKIIQKTERNTGSKKIKICGGVDKAQCSSGYTCRLIGNQTNASGICVSRASTTPEELSNKELKNDVQSSTTDNKKEIESNSKATTNPSFSLATIKKSVPSELLGFWKFEKILALTKAGEWAEVPLERIPIGLHFKKINAEGICSDPYYQKDGNELGLVCRKGYRPLMINGDQIIFPPEHTFAETFAGFKNVDSYLPRGEWPTPSEFKVAGNNLEFTVIYEKDGKPLYKYIFSKLIYPKYNPVNITLSVENPLVKAGTDMIISGYANTQETIRIYLTVQPSKEMIKLGDTGTATYGYSLNTCTATGICSSPPIIEEGSLVPLPPSNLQTKGKFIEFDDPKYFDCPFWTTNVYMDLYKGNLVVSDVLCIKPSSSGKFQIKYFNAGYSSLVGYKEKIPVTVNAKLASQDVFATAKVELTTCAATPGLECSYANVLNREKCTKVNCAQYSPVFSEPAKSVTPTQTLSLENYTWKTYINSQWSFEIQYPSHYTDATANGMFKIKTPDAVYEGNFIKKGAEINNNSNQTYVDKPNMQTWYDFKIKDRNSALSQFPAGDFQTKLTDGGPNGPIITEVRWNTSWNYETVPCYKKSVFYYDETLVKEIEIDFQTCGSETEYKPVFEKMLSTFKFIK